jgi:hypothetical protein
MKMSLLEMTQSILSAMDSDDVNSIDETVESLQVATNIKEAYFELIAQRDWPFLKTLSSLEGLADTSNPTKMRMPEGCNKILWVRYNKKGVEYMAPSAFKEMIDNRDVDSDTVDANGYRTDVDPTYWTTYDDDYVIFDSYDSAVDSTLQESKSTTYAIVIPAWTHEDSFIPVLPAKMFPTLLADAKGTSFLNQKQQANPKEEAKARRGRVRFQREAHRSDAAENDPASNIQYGRR